MANKLMITCLSTGLKKILEAESHHIEDAAAKRTFDQLVQAVPDCKNGAVVGLETENHTSKPGRSKRAPSPYTLFIGQCIKERPKDQPVPQAMKGCALKWRERKR